MPNKAVNENTIKDLEILKKAGILEINSIPIASLTDIGCMKIDAISSRGTKRDFVDVYAIIHQGEIKLSDLLDAFAKKYGSLDYNLEHIKKSLIYFKDAENDPMPIMLMPLDWKTVKAYFISEIKKI